MREMNFTSALVAVFLLLSLAFVAYLYPLPDDNVARVLSTMTPAEKLEVGPFLASSYWASWLTNVLILALGVCSAFAWMLRHGRAWRGWVAVATAGLFALLCIFALVIQAGDGSVIEAKASLLRRLWSAHAWTFFAAELHRLLAMIVALMTVVAMSIALRKAGSQ